ncbi:hypothetical protein BJY04DRAFT_226219 [Aspergillus karnatakaensis]|uniref:uncharacterized protein n=1 Tax=Aspergillus karnatakaensis TaxID=1810916 RepID=UPI003CCE4830
MLSRTVFTHALVIGLAASASIRKRWTNGSSATGPTDPDVVSSCTYWANDIASHDTCAALQDYFGITTQQLASWNPSLSVTDCTLTEGNSYCVEGPNVPPPTSTTRTTTTTTTSTRTATTATTTTPSGPSPTQPGIEPSCNEFYRVITGDTCYDIAVEYGIQLQQFYEWNPAVGTSCAGLQAGYFVCVGIPGQTTTQTTRTTTASTSTRTTTTAPEPTATGPSPQQPGIIDTCKRFYMVAAGDTCAEIAADNGITLNSFYTWNPAVGSDCRALWGGYYVCVGIAGETTTTTTTRTTTTTTSTATGPSPTQPGLINTCTSFYRAQAGDTCQTITQQKYPYINSQVLFTRWNPAVGSDCAGLLSGYYYCVATELHQPMPGIISSCRRYYQVKAGDTCWSIQQQYGITAGEFNRWNPLVGSDCGSLWVRYFVCVAV